ncbi:hypothetical protein BH11PSE5_BH11PSE5_22830 [soil metagenome]
MLIAASLLGISPSLRSQPFDLKRHNMGTAETLSVMTYNVKGLPWPVAWGRDGALDAIGQRLGQLRSRGRQPHIVALQEAFTDEAKAIGQAAGYTHIATGPAADMHEDGPVSADDRRFASAGSWTKGETQGKFVDSGLQILSDYPIVRIRRAAFPNFACAGYDCLANKGVLLVAVTVPGVRVPVEILTTHLNSRHASGVSDDRSLYAYQRQVEFLSRFVATNHDTASPLIMAGDFNMGPHPSRRSLLLGSVRGLSNDRGRAIVRDGLSSCLSNPAGGIAQSADARWILKRGRDWQFMSDGENVGLKATHAAIPFGRAGGADMLSDHMGFSVDYRLSHS